MHISVITTEDELYALQPEWSALLASSGQDNPFVMPDMAISWWQAFCGRHCELLVCTTRDGSGVLTGILPLYRKKGSGWLQPLMTPGYAESWNLIARPGCLDHVTMDFVEWLQSQPNWHGIRMLNVPEDSPSISALRSAALALGMPTLVRPSGSCMITSLNGSASVDALLSEIPDYRRLVLLSRRMQESHKVKYGLTRLTPGVLRKIAVMERAPGWRGKTGFFSSTAALDFMRRFSMTPESAETSRVFTLHIDDKLAAYVMGFECGDEIRLYFSGAAATLSGFSPVFLLFRMIMQYSIRQRLKSCNFLIGDEEYRSNWKASPRPQTANYIFKNSLYGRLSYFYNAYARPFFLKPLHK